MHRTMLYKHPGAHQICEDWFDYTIVDADAPGAIEGALAEGWHRTPTEAVAAGTRALLHAATEELAAPDDAPTHADLLAAYVEINARPTRAELEWKATELGIKFDGRWGDKKLLAAIQERL